MGALPNPLIENLVSNRDTEAAQAEIRRQLRQRKFDEALLLQSMEWYRRLGLYLPGYRLALRALEKDSHSKTQVLNGQLAFWIARYLYLMGATRLSLKMIERMEGEWSGIQGEEAARNHHFMGEVYLVVGDYEKARKNYLKAIALEPEPRSRSARICRIGLADTLVGLGKLDEALEIVKNEKNLTQEPVALGVLLSCEGEYLARQGRFSFAIEKLQQAASFMPVSDRTVDRALWCKWMGWSQARMGCLEEGKAKLRKAREILMALGIRPEAVFDVLHFENQLEPLSSEERQRIQNYPGLDSRILEKFGPRIELQLGLPDPEIVIDFGTDEVRHRGRWSYGLSLEIRLLGLLGIAGEWGIPSIRAIDLLWPDEPLALLQLEKRLEQILRRLNGVYGVKVAIENQVLRVSPQDLKLMRVIRSQDSTPRLLLATPKPSAAEVMDFYSLKKSGAYALLKSWRTKSLLLSQG